MARKNPTNGQIIETSVSEQMQVFEPYLDQLPLHEREAVRPLLEHYCWYNAQFNDARDHINEEGSVLSIEGKTKENPYVNVAHKFSARASDHFTKVMKTFKNSIDDSDDDELMKFLKGE